MNFINTAIARFVGGITEITKNLWQNVSAADYSIFQVTLDILLVAIVFYWVIMLIRGTRATNIALGIVVIALIFALSRWFNLLALSWLLDRFLTVALIAIPIIFQQEFRRGLEKLGKTKFFLAQEAKEIDFVKSEVIEACFELASRKLGALLVFRGEVSLKEYIDTGVVLNSRITKELLASIFLHDSQLHDGAVIIDKNRLVAASCVLPHSFKEYGHTFGTRHKAALGLSEITDARIVVISEQKGTVSYVEDGKLHENITTSFLEEKLFNPKKKHVTQKSSS